MFRAMQIRNWYWQIYLVQISFSILAAFLRIIRNTFLLPIICIDSDETGIRGLRKNRLKLIAQFHSSIIQQLISSIIHNKFLTLIPIFQKIGNTHNIPYIIILISFQIKTTQTPHTQIQFHYILYTSSRPQTLISISLPYTLQLSAIRSSIDSWLAQLAKAFRKSADRHADSCIAAAAAAAPRSL